LIGSVLIADLGETLKSLIVTPALVRSSDQTSMYVVMPTMLDPSMAPEGIQSD